MSSTIAEVHATLTAPGQPFEMEEVVIRGIATRTWKHAPASLRDVLVASRAQGDRVFLVYEDETLTFEEHFRAAAHLAHGPARPLRRAARRPGGHRHAELPGVVGGLLGGDRAPAPSWCPSTPGGPAPSWSTAWPTPVRWLPSSTPSAAERLVDHLGALPELRAVIVARLDEGRGAPLPDGALRFDEVLGEVPVDAELPDVGRRPRRTTPRSSTRRAPPGGRRARSAPTATSART